MSTWRWSRRVTYALVLPTVALAAGILGYYTLRTAARQAQLGEETIAASTLLLVREKVETIERYVIAADNTVFDLVDIDDPDALVTVWRPQAAVITPSVRSVLLLSEELQVLGYAIRGSDEDRQAFLALFQASILPQLELTDLPEGRLKHLHQRFEGRSYLISYRAFRDEGRLYYAVAHHDTGYIVREELPGLFATEEAKQRYNVVDEDNRRLFGPSLAQAGDYVVGHRFPTTLYGWRLQVAPEQAQELTSHTRTRRINEVALITVSFVVILLGMAFLLYAAAQERRLNQLKSEFIANVSHELKTPLSVVRMFGELLLTKRVRSEEKKEQYLEIICRESERLTALIENVLDFSALERGKQTYEMVEGNLGDVVTRAVETFRYRMERDGAEVTLEVADSLPPVLLDEHAIVLAVVNLLDNAAKYGGGSKVSVSVAGGDRYLTVRVRDRGPGVPEEAQRRIFERFYRVERSSPIRGSGIGLSLVKHIVEAHGGRAWAENDPEGGAAVSFTVPIATRSREPAEGRASLPTV